LKLFSLGRIAMAGFLASSVFATKPSISVDDLVKRSDVVAVGKVRAAREKSRSRPDGHGSWTPQVYQVDVTIVAKLMGDIGPSVEFEEEELRFEPGKKFVLFLQAHDGHFNYLKAPAKLMEATPGAIEIVKSCIERSAYKKTN